MSSTLDTPSLRDASQAVPFSEKDAEQIVVDVHPTEDTGDVGLHEFSLAMQSGMRVAPQESKRIARKFDLWILPMLCLCEGICFLDKTAINYGNLYGMSTALHLSGNQFSWFGSIFYIGYLVGNYPDSWLLQRYRTGKVLAIATFIWGTIILTTPACTNFSGTMANRFFLGFVEAIVSPGLTVLTSFWYTQSEIPLRMLIWYSFSGWAGIFGGLIAYGVGHIKNPAIDLWKYVFLILGAMSIAFSIMLWFFFPDSPTDTRFLTPEEKVLAVKRVAESKLGVKNTKVKMYQIKYALVDPKTYFLLVASVAGQIPNGIVTTFSTIIIQGMGFTTLQTTLLNAVAACFQAAGLFMAGFICMRFKNMRTMTTLAGNIICIMAAALLTYLPSEMKWGRLVSYWLTQFETVALALSFVLVTNNVAGFTKKTFMVAVVFSGFSIGNAIGPHFLIASEAPRYPTATKAMLVGYAIRTVSYFALGVYMWWSNIKRDRKHGKVTSYEDQLKGEEAGMHDLTEFENPYHRYVL